jgi:hypothetical protein
MRTLTRLLGRRTKGRDGKIEEGLAALGSGRGRSRWRPFRGERRLWDLSPSTARH